MSERIINGHPTDGNCVCESTHVCESCTRIDIPGRDIPVMIWKVGLLKMSMSLLQEKEKVRTLGHCVRYTHHSQRSGWQTLRRVQRSKMSVV